MVVSAVGRDPMAHCKVTGSVSHRYFNSLVISLVLDLIVCV